MIYCSNCGTANRDGSRFCNECGTRLGSFFACPDCDFPNLNTARFCNGCGKLLSSAAAETPSPTAASDRSEAPHIDEEEPLESEVPILAVDMLGFEGLNASPTPTSSGAPGGASSPRMAPSSVTGWSGDRMLAEDIRENEESVSSLRDPRAAHSYPELSATESSDAMSELLLLDMLAEVETAEGARIESLDAPEAEIKAGEATFEGPIEASGLLKERQEEEPEVEHQQVEEKASDSTERELEDKTLAATGPAASSLPTWLVEEDLDDISSNRDSQDGRSPAFITTTKAASSEADGDIEIARSFSSVRQAEVTRPPSSDFAGAGAAFTPVAKESWQPLGFEQSSAAGDAGAKASSEGTSASHGRPVLVILALVLAIIALLYIFDAQLARSAINGSLAVADKVIEGMLALAGQK